MLDLIHLLPSRFHFEELNFLFFKLSLHPIKMLESLSISQGAGLTVDNDAGPSSALLRQENNQLTTSKQGVRYILMSIYVFSICAEHHFYELDFVFPGSP